MSHIHQNFQVTSSLKKPKQNPVIFQHKILYNLKYFDLTPIEHGICIMDRSPYLLYQHCVIEFTRLLKAKATLSFWFTQSFPIFPVYFPSFLSLSPLEFLYQHFNVHAKTHNEFKTSHGKGGGQPELQPLIVPHFLLEIGAGCHCQKKKKKGYFLPIPT